MRAGPVVNTDNSCTFWLWAPEKEQVLLHVVHPFVRELKMKKDDSGYFSVTIDEVRDGCRYYFKPDKDMPDPGSHYQPGGVHGPSQKLILCIFNISDTEIDFKMPTQAETWYRLIDSNENRWKEDPGGDEKLPSPIKINTGGILRCSAGSTLVYCNLEQLSYNLIIRKDVN